MSFFNLDSTALLGCLNCPIGSLLAGFRPEPIGVNCKVFAAETGPDGLVVVCVTDPTLVLVTEGVLANLLLLFIIDMGFFTSVDGCLKLSFVLGTVDCLLGFFFTSV